MMTGVKSRGPVLGHVNKMMLLGDFVKANHYLNSLLTLRILDRIS
jgi:hypothetical protein